MYPAISMACEHARSPQHHPLLEMVQICPHGRLTDDWCSHVAALPLADLVSNQHVVWPPAQRMLPDCTNLIKIRFENLQ
jgi:hypothetical protein